MSGNGPNSSRGLLPLLLCALLIGGAPCLRAQSLVGSVAVSGAVEVPEREVESALRGLPGARLDSLLVLQARESVALLYRSRGFYDQTLEVEERADPSRPGIVNLGFRIREGVRTVLGEVGFAGLTRLSPEEFRARMTVRSGEPLDEAALAEDLEALLDRLEGEGHPLAACSVAAVERREEVERRLDLLIGVDEGPRVVIGEVTVEGNTETDPAVVVRETRLGAGEVYDPVRVAAIRGRLQRLGIFDAVEEPELYLRGDTGALRIRVREGTTNTFDGVLGYLPPQTPGGEGAVTGLAAVSMRNLFGTGRRFSLRWQRDDGLSQELGLRYVEPWVFGVPLNLGGGFFQRRQDTAYVRRVVDLAAELMLTEKLSVAASVLTESVIPSDSLTARALRSSTVSGSAGVIFDSRDDLYSPASGVRYRAEYSNGRKRTDAGSAGLQRVGLDFESWFGLFLRQVLMVGVHGRDVSGGSVEESDMVRLGGLRTLRGFRENQFLGTRLAWTALEYRYLLDRRSFAGVFLDTGYIVRPPGGPAAAGMDLFTFGYGTTLQVETGLGILAVSLALGRGDAFSDTKVHVGLVNEF
jgi:outer membrane protein insertion porin family